MKNARNQSKVDLKDTWGEISAGATYRFDKNVSGFAHVKRSFGGKLQQEYRVDAGVRFIF